MNSPVKVMVVEDDKDFLYTIGYWLKSKGYTVVTASNGLEAVETIKKEPVDIVFLDLQMPVMDGVEALKNIRKLNKNLPVILITAYATDERISDAEQYGISGFFSKDKDFSESVTLIESILRVHRGLKKE